MRKWRCDCERYVGLKLLTSDLSVRRFEQQVRRIVGQARPVGPKKWQAEALALQESVIGTTILAAARFARLRAP
jgi:hypothetical protein